MSAATSIIRRCLFRVVSAGSAYAVADDITSSTPFEDLELSEDSVREFVDAAFEELEVLDFESLRDRATVTEFLLDGNIDKCVSEACAFFVSEEITPCKKPVPLQNQIVQTKAPEPPQKTFNVETETSETVMAKKSAHNSLVLTGPRIVTSDGRTFALSDHVAADAHEKALAEQVAAAQAESRLPELKAVLGVKPRDKSQDEILVHILRNSAKMASFFGSVGAVGSAPAVSGETPAPKKRGPKPRAAAPAPGAPIAPEKPAPKKRGPKPATPVASPAPEGEKKRRGRPPGSGKKSAPVK